eukprot:TRINITY_DN607_c0_g3_i1.p2 TRINITY_DN607_c0_g3~~TRINITY_DN607_c0_g3_i1.p2  ORF type:complete len:206 (+),score=90.15 TRINITY_DN607_c0_g3_i1:73-618(+)
MPWLRALNVCAAGPALGLAALLASVRSAEEFQEELGATLRRAAQRGGWEVPACEQPTPCVRRRRAPMTVEELELERQRLPEGFEYPSDDDDELERSCSGGGVAEDEDADGALEFLGELTLCANIDHSVDAEQAKLKGVSEGQFERLRCQAEEDIMEANAEADRAENECQMAAAEAFKEFRG